MPGTGARDLSSGSTDLVETVKRFVNVHSHCNVSNLKKISNMSTLPPPMEKFLRTPRGIFTLSASFHVWARHATLAHAVAFAAIRTTKTREHFAESSYTTQLQVQTMHNTRIVLPVASTIARAEICLEC